MEQIQQVVETLTTITDLLYQENIPVAYRMLYLILPALEKTIGSIGQDDIQGELKDQLFSALQAMEDEDNILLADILQYEILERLRDCTEA